jgi:hypothetical protein
VTRHSDTHLLTLGTGYLTPGSGTVIERPVRVDEPVRVEQATSRARRSSALGTPDDFCHVLVGAAPYRYTSCGLRIKPPLPVEHTHRKPPCPNGYTPCPECVDARAEVR